MTHFNRKRLLLVEDDLEQIALFRAAFDLLHQSHQTFQLESAGTLAEAVSKISQNPYDLVILDLTLPDSAGTVTISKIREIPYKGPLAIFSGTPFSEEASATIRDQGASVLPKDELLDSLKPSKLQSIISEHKNL